MKDQYGELREVLLEVDGKAVNMLISEPLEFFILFSALTPLDRCRMSLKFYVCNASLVSIVVRL